MGLKVRPLALVSLALAITAFILTARVGAAPLPATATTVSSRPATSASANRRVSAIARAGDRVYIGGSFTSVGGQPRSGLAALDAATGQLVGSWRADVTGGPVWALGLGSGGGRLYAGGNFHSIGGRAQRALAGLDTASGADSGWHPRVDCPGLGMAVTPDTVYLVCGGASASGGNSVLAYSSSTGARRWSALGDGNVHGVARLGGAVYAGGHFTTVDGVTRKKAAAFSDAGGQLLPWDPHPDSSLGVFSMLADGQWLWLGGDFTTVGGVAQPHIARLGLDSEAKRDQAGAPPPTLDGPATDRLNGLRSATLPYPN